MIPRKQPGNQIRKYFTEPQELLAQLNLSAEQVSLSEKAMQQFRFKVPVAYARKIQAGEPKDPLLLQILPVEQENRLTEGYHSDPLLEANHQQQPGLLQKYQGRALLLVTPGCAINCRYCFRRHYPYDDKGHFWQQIDDNIQQLKNQPDIEEIILSGGDPLSLSDNKFTQLMTKLEFVPHLKRVRIHTRYPMVEPERISRQLIDSLSKSRLQVIMVLHINHAREFGEDNQLALSQLNDNRITLLNQSVLLKGVNNCLQTLTELSEALIKNHIHPYYLHLLDRVQGSAHFEVSETEAIELYKQLRASLPGYMLPRLVREIPGKTAKSPIFVDN